MMYRGPRHTAKPLLVAATSFAVAAIVWMIVLPRMQVPELKPDLSGPPVPHEALATETTYPHYLSDGRKVHEDWLAAISRYSDVRDCLLPEERHAVAPDLRRFDWAAVRGQKNRNICLYRVFSTLGTPERGLLWLETQGMHPRIPVTRNTEDGQETRISGGYSPSREGTLLPGGSFLGRWIMQKAIYGESISATWSEDGRLLYAGFSSNTL